MWGAAKFQPLPSASTPDIAQTRPYEGSSLIMIDGLPGNMMERAGIVRGIINIIPKNRVPIKSLPLVPESIPMAEAIAAPRRIRTVRINQSKTNPPVARRKR